MNRRQIALKLALKDLGIPSDMGSFETRLIMQKSVYLIQAKGFDLGYHFSWYLHGPYSRDLTADAYSLPAVEIKNWRLGEKAIGLIKSLKKVFTQAPAKNAARWFEILASVLFAIKTEQAKVDVDGLKTVLNKAGKKVLRQEVNYAVQILKKENFVCA